MKRRNKIISLLIFIFLGMSSLQSQIDTCFWFAVGWVTPDHTWKDDYKLHIAGQPGTVVRLRQPAAIAPNQYDTTFTIGASFFTNITFWRDKLAGPTNLAFDSLEVRPANTVLPYGLYISSTNTITAVFDVMTRAPSFLNTETYSLKGQNGLGTEFVCPFQTIYRNKKLTGDLNGDGLVTQPKQQINIVATKANTTVWITPRCAVVGHPANVTYSVFLPVPGSAYTCENMSQNTYQAGMSLAGTIVSSDKPIAVTVHDDSVNNPDSDFVPNIGCYDLMGDQIVPVDLTGKDYIVNLGNLYKVNQPAAGSTGMRESAYIVGTADFTQLTINDGGPVTTTLINTGDTYRYPITQPVTYINSTKNVYVIHGSGYGCELGEAILPPLSCAGSSLVAFTRNSQQRFSLNILCKNGAQTTFSLQNPAPPPTVTVPILASDFTVVPGTGTLVGGPYWGAHIEMDPIGTSTLPVGTYTIINTNTNTAIREFALAVFDGSTTSGGLYHYMSSFLRKTDVVATNPAPVCANSASLVLLTGTISGASVNGFWATSGGTPGVITASLNNGVVSATYSLSPVEAATTQTLIRIFTLTSTGCSPQSQTVSLLINPPPLLSSGSGSTMCKNNISPIILSGSYSNCIGATWTGGFGGSFGPPGPNTTYTPSAGDLAAGTITLTLGSSGPLTGCLNNSTSITYTFTNPPNVSAGASTVVCTNSSSFALNGSITGYTTGLWNTTGTGTFFPGSASPTGTYMLSASDLTLTNLIFTLTSVPGPGDNCAAVSNTMQVNIIPKPLVQVPADFTVCSSIGAIVLTGTVSGAATTGNWYTINGGGVFTQIPPSNANYTLSLNETLIDTVLVFVLGSSGGICPSATDSVRVNVVKPPSVFVNANNSSVCENAPIQLTGTVTGFVNTGVWTSSGTGSFFPSNTALGGQYFPSPFDVSTGSVVLMLTANTPSCGATASFTALFIDAPQALFNFPAGGRCVGSAVPFSNVSQASGTMSLGYNWNFGEAPGSITTATNPIYTYTNPGSYLVTLTVTGSNSCQDTITRRVNIAPLPIANYSVTNACQGSQTIFKDLSQTLAGGGYVTSWLWQWGDGSSPQVTGIPTSTVGHTYSVNTQYLTVLTVSTSLGCTNTSTLAVNINVRPDAEFGMTNNPSVAQEPVYFSDFSTPPGGITSWLWNFGDGSPTSADQTPTHSFLSAGNYYIHLTISDANGCTDTVTKMIEISLLPQVPTAFTPNNDNNNDLLFVKGGPFNKMLFRVYDNWGVLLFETKDQNVGWDGKKDGVNQEVGVYVWTLEVEMYNNRVVKKNGDVTLIR